MVLLELALLAGVLALPILAGGSAGIWHLFHVLRGWGDVRCKQNHALEHATCAVLAELGEPGRGGVPRRDGFVILGPVDPFRVDRAARLALARLAKGERTLLWRRHCASGLLLAVLLGFGLALALLGVTPLGRLGLFRILAALVIANLAAPTLATIAQRPLLSSPAPLEVLGVEVVALGRGCLVRTAARQN